MHIEPLKRAFAICLLCLLLVGAAGCRSDRDSTDPAERVTAAVESGGTPTGYTATHFPTFEVLVPENWSVRGNVGKLYEGDGMFLLAGPLTSDGEDCIASLEETLSEELQLFFNTEYYRSQTRFTYEGEPSSEARKTLKGTLFNDRAGTSLRFAGALDEGSRGYFVYFWPDASGDGPAERRMEVSYESFRAL